MNSEKQNNERGWRNVFLQWERGETEKQPEKDLLWNRLYSRLQPSRKKKKAILFTYAIATVLLFSFAVFFFPKENTDHSLQEVPNALGPSKKPIKDSFLQYLISNNDSMVATKKNYSLTKEHILSRKIPPREINIQASVLSINQIPEDSFSKISVASKKKEKEITDSLIIDNATAISTKKIRIVHMNEWSRSKPPSYVTLRELWKENNKSELILEEIKNPERSIWPGRNKNKPNVHTQN